MDKAFITVYLPVELREFLKEAVDTRAQLLFGLNKHGSKASGRISKYVIRLIMQDLIANKYFSTTGKPNKRTLNRVKAELAKIQANYYR
jgi:hypothetical protein